MNNTVVTILDIVDPMFPDPRDLAITQKFLELRADLVDYFTPLSDTMYAPLDPIEAALKLNRARSAAFICILSSFFLCLGLNFIRNPLLRRIYSTSCGIFLNFYFWGVDAFLNAFLILSTYAIMLLLPRNQASTVMAWWAGGLLAIV